MTKTHFRMPIHVVKKLDLSKKSYWTIKVVGILFAFLLSGLLCTIFAPGTFVTYYEKMAYGIINPKNYETFMLFLETAGLLLLIAFALAPAFKMKFWNIGAEGQISVGCLVTAGIMYHMATPTNSNHFAVVILCLVFSVLAGIIWAVIPAICKAFFNTNETLFTLMMNYVATTLISIFISIWIKSGSQSFPTIHEGQLEDLFGMKIKYLWNIIFVVVIVALMIVYMKKTKHGYELSVVGASINTARYVGISKSEFSAIVTGMFFLIIIATEFFINYKLLVNEDSKLKPVVDKINNFFTKVSNGLDKFFNKINFFKIFKKKKPEAEAVSSESKEDK